MLDTFICFVGTTERISKETRNMGGCVSYFVDNPMINIGGCYDVQICGYITWVKI